jgi:hypothetical protein
MLEMPHLFYCCFSTGQQYFLRLSCGAKNPPAHLAFRYGQKIICHAGQNLYGCFYPD